MAREALTRLSPVSAAAVDDDWRDQLADYLLNQQGGPEATATRGHLRRSEAARGWARSIEDSLDHLYENGNAPVIPEPEAGGDGGGGRRMPRRRRSKADGDTEVRGGAGLSPEARSAVKRRRLIAGGAVALVALLAVLVWPIGLLTGDDDDGGGNDQAAAAAVAGCGPVRAAPAGRGARHERRRGGRGGRAGRQPADDRPGPAAGQQGGRGVRGLALRLAHQRGVAGRSGHQPPGRAAGPRRAAAQLRQLHLHRHLAREGGQQPRALGHVGAPRAHQPHPGTSGRQPEPGPAGRPGHHAASAADHARDAHPSSPAAACPGS